LKSPADEVGLDLLPDSATDLQRSLAFGDYDAYSTAAIDPDLIRRVKDPARCPKALLPYLAWERSLGTWDPSWPEWRQRDEIAQSLDDHRRAGTRWAMDTAIRRLNLGATVDEWFEYAGRPYCFRLRVPVPDGWTAAQTRTVYSVAIAKKNARSYFDGLRLQPPPMPTPVTIAAVAIVRRVIYAQLDSMLSAIGFPPTPVRVAAIAVRRSSIYAHC
jgi:phage tail P2-like protein